MATMTTVLCLCRVGDFDTWRPQFERDVAAQTGVQSYRIWRSQDDRNPVAVIETRESRDAAEAVWSSPQARQAMERHGVDLSSVQIQYFDEIAAETR
jgi:quinol monooxygenase YgiN